MNDYLSEDLNHVLSHTKELWNEVRDQHLFITGGTGFFGIWLLKSLLWANKELELNAKVTVLSRNPDYFLTRFPHLKDNQALTFILGDVRNFDFPKGSYSHIVHAATEASEKLNRENPLLMLDTIIEGTRHTLDFAVQCGAKKVLLTSSGAVYGKQPLDLTHIPESYQGAPEPNDPLSAYAQGKRLSEFLATLYSQKYGLECKIARGFAFVGPYLPLDIHFAIGNFIRDALLGQFIYVKGDGTPYRSYLYASDMVIWLWTILFKGQNCIPYNVGSDDDRPLGEIANIVAESFLPHKKVEILQKSNKENPPSRYIPSIERIKDDLKIKPLINISSAIQKTIAFYQRKNDET